VNIEDIPDLSDQVLMTAEYLKDELTTVSINASNDFVREFNDCTTMAKRYIERRQAVVGKHKGPTYWSELLELQRFLREEVIARRAILAEKAEVFVGAVVSRWYARDVLRRVKYGMAGGCERVNWQHPIHHERRNLNARDEDMCIYPPPSTAIHVL